jgi:hypothetical protein
MPTKLLTKTIVKTGVKTKLVPKFIRLPIDEITTGLLSGVKARNPYFNDLDALRWILGKLAYQKNREKLSNWIDTNVLQKSELQGLDMTEDEIYAIASTI